MILFILAAETGIKCYAICNPLPHVVPMIRNRVQYKAVYKAVTSVYSLA